MGNDNSSKATQSGQTQSGHWRRKGVDWGQSGHCHLEELAQWRRDVRRVAERRARKAWGGCPGGGWLGNALECIAGLAAVALFAALTWLLCMATPDQPSAEADMERATMAASGAAE